VASAPFPLTDLQEAYLVGSTRLVELGGVRPSLYLELELVDLDLPRAERAVDLLIAHHDHLRTEILPEGVQRVMDRVPPFELPVVDLTGLAPDRQQAALSRTRQRMSQQGVGPTGWPLFELAVSRLRPHRVRVHLALSLLLLDGRSIRQVWHEWQVLYRDPAAPLATAASTFQQCRLAQLAHERTDAYAADWRYWQSRLDSLPEAPRLPLARRPEAIDRVRFTRRTCHLTRAQWQRLSANVRQHRLLPVTALLHLFAETLGGWAADPHFCLNVVHQGWSANRPETVGVVGQFGATLPLEIHGGGGYWDRARQTQSQLWRDFEHSAVSGVRIAREAAARRGRPPYAMLPYVFTSMLAPDTAAAGGPAGADRPAALRPACRTVDSSLCTPQVLIDNQVVATEDGGLDCVWDVVDDAFPPGLPELMFAAYSGMVSAVAGPDGARAAPGPVPAGHRDRVAALNRPSGPAPAGRLQDGFLRWAAARPDRMAVITPSGALSYRRLEVASRVVAGWLGRQGVGRGDVVPVVMAKGWEQVVAVLGVLRAGAAYCPLDAGLPPRRLRELLDEVAARVAIVQSHAAPDLHRRHGLAVLPVDRWEQVRDGGTGPVPDGDPTGGDPTDLAYVIYTSGSTGRPKGVMVEHRAALNTVCDLTGRIGLDAGDRVFGVSSLSFDLSVWDVFGTLAAGAALVLPAASERPDPVAWVATAARHRVTVWNSVPALAELLVEVAEQQPGSGRPPLRACLLSGDWIPLPLPDRLRGIWPEARIVALGGATEASIWSNWFDVDRVEPGWRSVPYGTPLRNQTMAVLDHRMEPRPPWAEGEIYIGGTGLARGYWRDPERTAERFVRHPRTGQRWYRTGDLGRYWPDGTIELLGRVDRQVKIQGFRVEPGEVEAAIGSHPAVRACLVSAERVPGGQRRLVALAVPRPGSRPTGPELLAHLRDRLPHYLVPSRLHVVTDLPLTANGKVDVERAVAMLPAPGAVPGRPDGAPDGEPDGALVQRLSRVWADLLGRDGIDIDDDFFALGGTSLLALRLTHRLRTELGVDLRFGQIFEAPTVRGLARRVAGGAPSGTCAVELASGEGTELVLFHPVGGAVTSYLELARAWPGPVRAFQSRGLVSGGHGGDPDPAAPEPHAPDLEAMAAGYRAELRARCPAGPYLLAGWSMGGVLAYEVGGQLARLGQECRIVMIDSHVPEPAPPAGPAARHRDFLRDLAGGHLPGAVAAALERAAGPDLARVARDLAVAHRLLPAATDVEAYTHLAGVHSHNARILAAYRPGRSSLPALLLAAGEPRGRPDPAPAWRALCPGVTMEVLPDDHYRVLAGERRAAAVVARVRAWLGRVRE
jgi:amino acid adenylation domain-containing protein